MVAHRERGKRYKSETSYKNSRTGKLPGQRSPLQRLKTPTCEAGKRPLVGKTREVHDDRLKEEEVKVGGRSRV